MWSRGLEPEPEPLPPLPLRPRGVAGLAAVVRVDSEDLWSPREGGGAVAAAGRAERDAGAPDGRSPAEPAGAAPGVEPELVEFLEGDPWEGCDDIVEWGFVEWCADIAHLKSSKIDGDATALLAMFLADGDTDGCSTRPSTALSRPASGPCSSGSLKGAAGSFADRVRRDQDLDFESEFLGLSLGLSQEDLRADCHPCPEHLGQEGPRTSWAPRDDLEEWELSFLLRSAAESPPHPPDTSGPVGALSGRPFCE